MSMSNLANKSTGLSTSSPFSALSIHPSSSQSIAIISTTTPSTTDSDVTATSVPFKQTASFARFIDRNSECTDLVGLVIACIIFLVAQTVLITIWYYLYVKIKWQRRSLIAIETQRQKILHDTGSHFPPFHYNQNQIPIKPVQHHFPHHLLLPAMHQYQQPPQQKLLVQQQRQLSPIDVRTEFETEQVYAPPTIYTGTVIRHRIGSRLSCKRGYGSQLSTFGTKRRSTLHRTLRGNLRKSGGFHFYPNVLSSPSKLITSDSQDESGKSRVYEVFREDEDITSGQVNSSTTGQEDEERKHRDRRNSFGYSARDNGSKRNFFYRI